MDGVETANASDALESPLMREKLTANELAAYLDDRLSPDERARVEDLLAQSPELRAELVGASRILSSAPQSEERPATARRPRWRGAAIGLLAAAAIVVAVVPSVRSSRHEARVSTERRSTADNEGQLVVVQPVGDSHAVTDGVRFVWESIPGASYRVIVTDSAGAMIWRAGTPDTTLAPGHEITLLPGAHYYWYVDAMRSDGSSLTSGPIEFTPRRP